MNTIDAIKTRRSVRSWIDKDIPSDVMQQILEAGRWSPSPLNQQPWHFIVIKNKETINTLSATAHHGIFLSQANAVVVVTVNKDYPQDAWLKEHEQHIYSGVCAMQNMWLSAWDLGLGACWVTVDEQNARGSLEIPEDQVLLGSLAFGYINGNPVEHRELDRKPLTEIVFYEKFGIGEEAFSNPQV